MYATIPHDHGYLRLAEPQKWETVHARFESLRIRRGSDDAEEARCIREGEVVRIWAQVGEPKMAAYLGRMLGYGRRCAYDRLRVAHALGQLPALELALERGETFYSIVRELTRVVVPETEKEWWAAAQGKSLREVEGMVSGRQAGDLPDAPPDPELVRHILRHEVSAATYARFRLAEKALRDSVGEPLDDDAILSMLATCALEGGVVTSKPPQVTATVCTECRRGWQDGAGAVVEIPKAAIEQLECHADHFDAKGNVTRYIPANTRRAVLARDHQRCRYPSCQSAHALEAHHIKPFSEGGGNDMDNLVTLCSYHHDAHHHGMLRIFIENGEVKFERVEPTVPPALPPPPPANDGIIATAEAALVRLGFKKAEAKNLIAAASAPGGTPSNLAALVRDALRLSAR